jgi:hypothetical protein
VPRAPRRGIGLPACLGEKLGLKMHPPIHGLSKKENDDKTLKFGVPFSDKPKSIRHRFPCPLSSVYECIPNRWIFAFSWSMARPVSSIFQLISLFEMLSWWMLVAPPRLQSWWRVRRACSSQTTGTDSPLVASKDLAMRHFHPCSSLPWYNR